MRPVAVSLNSDSLCMHHFVSLDKTNVCCVDEYLVVVLLAAQSCHWKEIGASEHRHSTDELPDSR